LRVKKFCVALALRGKDAVFTGRLVGRKLSRVGTAGSVP
jgi:hypothetical protein